jgi:hypothetical protein
MIMQRKRTAFLAVVATLFLNSFISQASADTSLTYWQRYTTAQQLFEQKKYQEALAILLPALKEQSNFSLLLLVGDIYDAENKPAIAFPYYKNAYALSNNVAPAEYNKKVLLKLFHTAFLLHNSDEERDYYIELLKYKLSPEERIYLETQLPKINIQSSSNDDQKKDNLLYIPTLDAVQNLNQQNLYQTSYKLVNPLLENHPTATVYLLAGDNYSGLEKPLMALDYYQQALKFAKIEKNESVQNRAMFGIARIQMVLGNNKEALAIYRQLESFHLDSEDKKIVETNMLRISDMDLSQHPLKNLNLYPRINLKNGSKSNSKLDNIQNLIQKNQYTKANKLIKPLLKNPSAEIYLLAGDNNSGMEKPKIALTYYQKAFELAKLKKNRSVSNRAMFGIARVQLALGDKKQAIKLYRQLLLNGLNQSDKKVAQLGLKQALLSKPPKPNNSPEDKKLAVIYKFIDEGKGLLACKLIMLLLNKHKEPRYYILAAKSMEAIDKPRNALGFYFSAYQLALQTKDIDSQREAVQGIGAMQMWMGEYVRATRTYKQLLTYHLKPKDYELARANLVKSYAYRDRNYTAFNDIPWDMEFTLPDMVEAALQTTLWLQQGDIAKELFSKYQPIQDKIKHTSYMYRDLKNIEWLLCQETAPYQFTPKYYYYSDTEDFLIQHATLDFRRYWSQYAQTYIAPSYVRYSQYGNVINGQTIRLAQSWNPNRYTFFNASIEPASYKNTVSNSWNPVLGSLTGTYNFSDAFALNAGAAREVVEAFTAVDNRILTDTYTIGTDLQPLPYLYISANDYRMNFSDNNNRKGYFFVGKASILPNMGIYTGYRIRNYHDKFKSPFYFSPNLYHEELFLLGISRLVTDTWRFYADGGYGKQTIQFKSNEGAGGAPSWFYKLGLRGPITRCIYFDLLYTNAAQSSAFTNGENYKFKELIASINISLD